MLAKHALSQLSYAPNFLSMGLAVTPKTKPGAMTSARLGLGSMRRDAETADPPA
jgi:hypothetical protein